ncbi:MAG TPA: DsbE family thiol:disulfide interchange protein [Woeseiaceae bacterium]|nr:DsbE family thiol:disulfide interchange protein [Woeseiaceae bacterium]
MNRYILPLVAVVIMIPILILGLQSDPSKLPSQYIGKPAPEFNLPTLKDPSRTLSSADLIGQVSLVNIWGTWCVGCRAEHGFLMKLAEQHQFPIFGINWRDDRQAALQWLEQYGDPYVASGFDQDGRVGIDWGAYGAPETFLISAEGQVVYRFPGPLNQTIWDQEFAPLIAGMSQ